jgi:hypothetical protein
MTTNNAGKLLPILIAMDAAVRLRASPGEARSGLYSKPLDAAIGQVPAPYCPGGRHG